MLLFIANHRNTVILAILQWNILNQKSKHLFLSGCRKILACEVASSHIVASVTLTKCQQKRHVSILKIQQK